MEITIQELVRVLAASWDKDTAYPTSNWSKDNPACGQCAVSSLIMQDYFGGDIVRFTVTTRNGEEKHYANLIDNVLVDVTRSQFFSDAVFQENKSDISAYSSIREKILDDSNTSKRYLLLRSRINQVINK